MTTEFIFMCMNSDCDFMTKDLQKAGIHSYGDPDNNIFVTRIDHVVRVCKVMTPLTAREAHGIPDSDSLWRCGCCSDIFSDANPKWSCCPEHFDKIGNVCGRCYKELHPRQVPSALDLG